MLERIRAAIHGSLLASSTSEPVKAWLTYIVTPDKQLGDVKKEFVKQLGIDLKGGEDIQLSVEGFILLDSSDASILDSSKDIVEIHRIPIASTSALTSSSKRSAMCLQNVQRVDERKQPALKKLKTAGKEDISILSIKSSNQQGSDVSTTVSRAVPSLPKGKGPEVAAESDDGSHSDSESSSSSSSSSSPSDSSSSSSSFSSSSASSSSSSSSSSGSSSSSSAPPNVLSSKQPFQPTHDAGKTTSINPQVPPGAGASATKARNARKRKRAALLKQAGKLGADVIGRPRPAISDVSMLPPTAKGTSVRMSTPAPASSETAEAIKAHRPDGQDGAHAIGDRTNMAIQQKKGVEEQANTQQAINEAIARSMPPLSQANKNKSRSMKRDAAAAARDHETSARDVDTRDGSRSKKIIFDSQKPTLSHTQMDTSMSEARQDSVPSGRGHQVQDDSPRPDANRARNPSTHLSVLESTSTTASPSTLRQRPLPPPPSTRSDLPKNVIVTSIDVEDENFVPGAPQEGFQAPPQVPYYRSRADESELDPNEMSIASLIDSRANGKPSQSKSKKEKRKEQQEKRKLVQSVNASQTATAAKEGSLAQELEDLEQNDWASWPDYEAAEARFAELPKCVAPGEGVKVVLKVLELSPASYLPDVSTYYGIVVALESTPHSSSITLRLHPACRVYEEEEYLDEVSQPIDGKPRYFGQDMVEMTGGSSGGGSDKTFSLDDIVDSRRLLL